MSATRSRSRSAARLAAVQALYQLEMDATPLATLLHEHLIGELTVNPGGDAEAWRAFLLLLGRAPDAVRAEELPEELRARPLPDAWCQVSSQHRDVPQHHLSPNAAAVFGFRIELE